MGFGLGNLSHFDDGLVLVDEGQSVDDGGVGGQLLDSNLLEVVEDGDVSVGDVDDVVFWIVKKLLAITDPGWMLRV